MENKTKQNKTKSKSLVGTRGRTFQGIVTKKFVNRIVAEFERTVYVQKYERYYRKKTRVHARITPDSNVEVGDLVEVRECRPLSKIIHFMLVRVVKKSGEMKK